MKNLMNRDEYLQKTNEGIIKDTIKKGWEKVKSFFKLGIKKIKDFIAIFDNEGNVFPVVSPCAVIDKFSDSEAVKVYAPKEVSKVTVDAGGNGCPDRAELNPDDEIYNYGPDGKEYAEWLKSEKYKDTPEYKNFLTLSSVITESKDVDDLYILDESWEGITKERNRYSSDDAFNGNIKSIDYKGFEEWINKFIDQRINHGGKTIIRAEDNRVAEPERNMLVFGAPGIGKSTIPNMVIKKYNENVGGDPSKMISLINVNCALLKAGDFLMPTMPKEEEITKSLKRFERAFPEASKYLDTLTDDEQESISTMIKNSGQFKSSDAPKSWLPSYKPIGGDIDRLLDSYANGGIIEDEDGFTVRTGNGGIIVFDEFLRCDPDVFGELMNFLLYRKIHDWKLGSKWVIIACSNRPCDDTEIENIWQEWNSAPAKKGRFSRIFQLLPDPESWKKWAKSKGCDDLILDFIFEKNSKVGNEYPRWHSEVKNGSGDSGQIIPINPRQWETAFNAINSYIIDNDYPNILKLSSKELETILEGVFDPDFIAEFTMWFEDHKNKIDLDMIIDDPTYLKLNKEDVDDAVKAKAIIQNLVTEITDKYKEDPSKLPDEKLANIITWVGRNFPGDVEIATDFLEDIISNVFKDNSEFQISKYKTTMMRILAAYPFTDFDSDIEHCENREKDPWPKGSKKMVLDMMRKYFPWRIKGDEILFYDKLEAPDIKKEAEE